jgi:hypothetical protein
LKIQLHIERLVLEGLPLAAAEKPLLRAAMETELTELLRNGALANQKPASAAFVRAPAIRVGKDTHPRKLGRTIAHAVNSALGQSGKGQQSAHVDPSAIPSRSQPGGIRNE